MKKSTAFIAFVAVVLLILLYTFIPKGDLANKSVQQAAVIQTIQTSSHLYADEFLNRIKQPNMTTIDIRTPEEYNSGHIDGALNIDFYAADFLQQLEKLDKNGAYSIYCRSGSRSGKALVMMNELGFTNVVDLKDGYSSIK